MTDITRCPICLTDLTENAIVLQHKDATRYKCDVCGQFDVSHFTLIDSRFDSLKPLIRAWIRRQNKLGIPHPHVGANIEGASIDWFEDLKRMNFPKTVNEKINALLEAYADIIKDDYNKIIKVNQYPNLIAEIVGKNLEDIIGLNQLLADLGYIWSVPGHPNVHIRMTAKGWLH